MIAIMALVSSVGRLGRSTSVSARVITDDVGRTIVALDVIEAWLGWGAESPGGAGLGAMIGGRAGAGVGVGCGCGHVGVGVGVGVGGGAGGWDGKRCNARARCSLSQPGVWQRCSQGLPNAIGHTGQHGPRVYRDRRKHPGVEQEPAAVVSNGITGMCCASVASSAPSVVELHCCMADSSSAGAECGCSVLDAGVGGMSQSSVSWTACPAGAASPCTSVPLVPWSALACDASQDDECEEEPCE